MKSKKIIVPIDLENPSKKINDVLYPKITDDKVSLVGVNTQKEWEYGMIILKGGGVTENDLFAKIVDSKIKIESVNKLLETLENYLKKVNDFSIGNVVYIEKSNSLEKFSLKKHTNRVSTNTDNSSVIKE